MNGGMLLRACASGIGLSLVALLGLGIAVVLGAADPERIVADSGRPPADDLLSDIPADQWLNSAEGGLSGDALRGKPVLVEFWTYLCYNCKNVEGWMKESYRKYGLEGLQVIGVHTPEFEVERNVDNVRDYIKKNGIGYPVAIDNGMKVWRRYNATNAWPAFLVYDRRGTLVYRQAGERAVIGAEQAIREALDEKPLGSSARLSGRDGMTVAVSAERESAREALLTVALRPEPGHLLVKSPPNEVRLEAAAGVTPPAEPLLLGEAFEGGDAGDVRYYEGSAVLRIPLRLDATLAKRDVDLSGTVVYHVCDAGTKVCARGEQAFSQRVGSS